MYDSGLLIAAVQAPCVLAAKFAGGSPSGTHPSNSPHPKCVQSNLDLALQFFSARSGRKTDDGREHG